MYTVSCCLVTSARMYAATTVKEKKKKQRERELALFRNDQEHMNTRKVNVQTLDTTTRDNNPIEDGGTENSINSSKIN